MLDDFYEIKEKKKKNLALLINHLSFITLGNSLRFEHTDVYIRYTYLLAAAGNNALASLGKLN